MNRFKFTNIVTRLWIIFFLLVLQAGSVFAANPRETLQAALDRACNRNDRVALGYSYTNGNGEKVQVVSGYKTIEGSIPNNVNALFEIGSTTKTFLAVVVLQMAEEGSLSLEQTPADYGWSFPNAGNITIEDLLKHTSGIGDYIKHPSLSEDPEGFSRKRTLMELIDLGLSMPPTSGWSYSNTNYLLLADIIEKNSGQTAEQEILSRIVEPLGLSETGFRRENEDPRLNHGYFLMEDYWDATTGTDPSLFSYAGAMISSLDDLEIFLKALFDGTLLSPSSIKEMTEFQTTPNEFDYGLGLLSIELAETVFYGHGGTTFGTRNYTLYSPETGETVVFYTTLYSDEFLPLLNQLLRKSRRL